MSTLVEHIRYDIGYMMLHFFKVRNALLKIDLHLLKALISSFSMARSKEAVFSIIRGTVTIRKSFPSPLPPQKKKKKKKKRVSEKDRLKLDRAKFSPAYPGLVIVLVLGNRNHFCFYYDSRTPRSGQKDKNSASPDR